MQRSFRSLIKRAVGTLFFCVFLTQLPVWPGPVSERILFVAAPTGLAKMYLIRPDRKDLVRLTKSPGREREPDISLAQRCVVYRGNRDHNEEIYRCNLKGEEITRLTHHVAVDRQPTWSPDGTQVAFCTQRWSKWDEIAIMDAVEGDLKPIRRLTTLEEQCATPSWSPDGKWIVYSGFEQGQRDLFLISTDGVKQRRLTRDRQSDTLPRWSPDGKFIVYQTVRGPRDTTVVAIYSVENDTIEVLDLPEIATAPAWSADGSEITYVALGSRYYSKEPQLQIYNIKTREVRKFELPGVGLSGLPLGPFEAEWTYFPYPWEATQ
jgi:TolB protein